jgi:hypothetical protein
LVRRFGVFWQRLKNDTPMHAAAQVLAVEALEFLKL